MRARGPGRLPRLTVQSSHADPQHASPFVGRMISNSIAPRKSGGTKEWGSGILSACQKKSSAGLIPIATKRTSRFAAIIQRSTEPFLI